MFQKRWEEEFERAMSVPYTAVPISVAGDVAFDMARVRVKRLVVKISKYVASKMTTAASRAVIQKIATKYGAKKIGAWVGTTILVRLAQGMALGIAKTVATAASTANAVATVVMFVLGMAGAIYDAIDPRGFNNMPTTMDELFEMVDQAIENDKFNLTNADVATTSYPVEVYPENYVPLPRNDISETDEFIGYVAEYLSALQVNSRGEAITGKDEPVTEGSLMGEVLNSAAVVAEDRLPSDLERILERLLYESMASAQDFVREGDARVGQSTIRWIKAIGVPAAAALAGTKLYRSLMSSSSSR